MDILNILAIMGSGFVFLGVIELVRRGKLKEKYSILWLLASLVLFIFSTSRDILVYASALVGIYYPPSFLFLLAFIFLLLITLHFSIVISGLSDKSKKLAQEISLLRQEMRDVLGRGMENRDKRD